MALQKHDLYFTIFNLVLEIWKSSNTQEKCLEHGKVQNLVHACIPVKPLFHQLHVVLLHMYVLLLSPVYPISPELRCLYKNCMYISGGQGSLQSVFHGQVNPGPKK